MNNTYYHSGTSVEIAAILRDGFRDQVKNAGSKYTPTSDDWKSHVILGVTHVKFHKRKVGDLGSADLAIIASQWLPAVREQWKDANDAQRTDAAAFEAAIACRDGVEYKYERNIDITEAPPIEPLVDTTYQLLEIQLPSAIDISPFKTSNGWCLPAEILNRHGTIHLLSQAEWKQADNEWEYRCELAAIRSAVFIDDISDEHRKRLKQLHPEIEEGLGYPPHWDWDITTWDWCLFLRDISKDIDFGYVAVKPVKNGEPFPYDTIPENWHDQWVIDFVEEAFGLIFVRGTIEEVKRRLDSLLAFATPEFPAYPSSDEILKFRRAMMWEYRQQEKLSARKDNLIAFDPQKNTEPPQDPPPTREGSR